MTTFERSVEVRGAYDKRNPDSTKNYGIHAMTLRFVLKGPKGAMQFVFYTAQHLRHVADELYTSNTDVRYNPFHGTGADIGYHSLTPHYEGQPCHDCDLLPGGKCYYDGTSLGATKFEDEFIAGGDAVVWPMLEKRYHEIFGDEQ